MKNKKILIILFILIIILFIFIFYNISNKGNNDGIKTLYIYKYSDNYYSIENDSESYMGNGILMTKFSCKTDCSYNLENGIVYVYDNNDMFYINLNNSEKILNPYSLTIDTYKLNNIQGYVVKDSSNNVFVGGNSNPYILGNIVYNNKSYMVTFNAYTLSKNYISISSLNDSSKKTSVYNIISNEVVFSLNGIYYFSTYDENSTIYYEFIGVESEGNHIYDDNYNFVKDI